jgi:uncharacterized membrane protein YdjX (TVP38/TMEM64 family)
LTDVPAPKTSLLRRIAPFLILALVIFLAWKSGVTQMLSLDALRAHEAELAAFTAEHPWLSLGGYILVYILVVVFSLPGALIMTLTGGLLFGTWLGGAAAITSATIGATLIFLVGRSTFGDLLRSRAGTMVGRLVDGFERNATSYLLTLRLIPGVPFFAVNLAAGLVRMRVLTYVFITVIGIMPGSLIYASIGSSLVNVFARGEDPDLGVIFEPQVLGPLLGLAALSLLPAAYRVWRARRTRP